MGNRDCRRAKKRVKFKSFSMLKSDANKSKETRIIFYHSRVLKHVKATCICHTLSLFAINPCVIIASVGL